MSRNLSVSRETWPLARPFAISRGVKTKVDVVVVKISCADSVGWGECVPYPRYGETVNGVFEDIKKISLDIENGIDRENLFEKLPAGAARNAIDCALWDLEAKSSGLRVWELAGISEPVPVITAETIGLDTPEIMAENANRLRGAPLIKVKLNKDDVISRMTAVRESAPSARIIVDPNEGWTIDQLFRFAPELKNLGIEMIEQPIPVTDDNDLIDYSCPIPLCADEACHTTVDLPGLISKYQMINIKLDKTGGLTEALSLANEAAQSGFKIMTGCMVGTSLSMAPGTLLGGVSEFVDLDGPLLLKHDRQSGLDFEDGHVNPPRPELWG